MKDRPIQLLKWMRRWPGHGFSSPGFYFFTPINHNAYIAEHSSIKPNR